MAYAVDSKGDFGTIDLNTGAYTTVGAPNPNGYAGVATFSNHVFAEDGIGNLLSVNPTTGATSVIGNGGVALVVFAGSTSAGLYGLDANNDLYSVNSTTGAASLIGSTGLGAITDGFANSFAVSSNTLFYTFETSSMPATLYTLNPLTGTATAVGPITGADGLSGAGYINNTLYGFSAVIFNETSTNIYTVDTATGAAMFVTPTPATIFGASALVPEPSTLTLAGLAIAGLLGGGVVHCIRGRRSVGPA
jgi:hypothetical protein